MLGITVADAVLVGTLILAVLAAWQGKKDGATAAKFSPSQDGMKELAASIHRLGDIIKEAAEQREGQVLRDMAGELRRVADRLE